MIPISKDTKLEFFDETSNVTYSLRPLIGENESRVNVLRKKLAVLYVEAKNKGDKFTDEDQEDFDRKNGRIIDEIFNMFLVGWIDNKGNEVKPEKPSESFNMREKDSFIAEYVFSGKINYLSVEQKKSL